MQYHSYLIPINIPLYLEIVSSYGGILRIRNEEKRLCVVEVQPSKDDSVVLCSVDVAKK